MAEGSICFGLAHQDSRCLRCWFYMETDGELGSRAQVRDLSTGLLRQSMYQNRASSPGESPPHEPPIFSLSC